MSSSQAMPEGMTAEAQESFLTTLPREIRDEIFKLAFCEDFAAVCIDRHSRAKRTSCYAIRDRSHVLQLQANARTAQAQDRAPRTRSGVCTQPSWHPQSGRLRHSRSTSGTATTTSPDAHDFITTCSNIRASINKMALPYPLTSTAPPAIAELLNSFPRLTELNIDMPSMEPPRLHAFRVHATPDVSAAAFQELSRLRGVFKFQIDPGRARGMWTEMASDVEAKLKEFVCRPKDGGSLESAVDIKGC